MIKINKLILLFAVFAGTYSGSVSAFCFFDISPRIQTQVSEYYDSQTDRFYLNWSEEVGRGCPFRVVEPLDPSLHPTGLAWDTWTSRDQCTSAGGLCASAKPLCRFRNDAAPEPASIFMTISEGECEFLKRPGSGWTFMTRGPRLAAFQNDPATGQCPAATVPVYRFYNNRWQEGLSNHRFVADEEVRAQMRSRAGWTEEGVAFCALLGSRSPIASQAQVLQGVSVLPLYCSGGEAQASACVTAVNMPTFTSFIGPFQSPQRNGLPQPPGLFEKTGVVTEFVSTLTSGSDSDLAAHSFLQLTDYPPRVGGFFVTSSDRTAGNVSGLALSSMVPLPGRRQELAQPFAAYDTEMELVLAIQPFVKRVRTTGDDSQAFVFSEIVFVDVSSGKKLVLELFGIGTPPVGDFVGAYPDGNVLAVFALGPAMTFGRSVGLPMLRTSRTFDSDNAWGYGGDFGYRINRSEFERLLQKARAAQPLLSVDARDYRIEGFSFKGQVAGIAEIGYNLQKHELSLVRP